MSPWTRLGLKVRPSWSVIEKSLNRIGIVPDTWVIEMSKVAVTLGGGGATKGGTFGPVTVTKPFPDGSST